MKTRIISGIVGIFILAAVLLAPSIVMKIAVMVLALIGLQELFTVTKVNHFPPLEITGYIGCFLIILALSLNVTFIFPVIYVFIFALFVILMLKLKTIWLKDASKVFFLTLYVSLFFGSLIRIRDMENGKYLIWFVFIIAFLTDTFAYFTGKFLGKHKLCPNISPKKTVEGAIGGILGGVIGLIAYCAGLNHFFGLNPNYILVIAVAVTSSAVSQLGDLSASVIKREYRVKDYGKIMPGHGGVMDRFDSVLFVAPFIFVVLLALNLLHFNIL